MRFNIFIQGATGFAGSGVELEAKKAGAAMQVA